MGKIDTIPRARDAFLNLKRSLRKAALFLALAMLVSCENPLIKDKLQNKNTPPPGQQGQVPPGSILVNFDRNNTAAGGTEASPRFKIITPPAEDR